MPALERELVGAHAAPLLAAGCRVAVLTADREHADSLQSALSDQWLVGHIGPVEARAHADLDELAAAAAGGDAQCDVLIASNVLPAGDAPSERLLAALLAAVKDGGHVLFRQNKESADYLLARLTQCIEVYSKSEGGTLQRFLVKYVKQMEDSIHAHRNPVDFCWCLQKVVDQNKAGDKEHVSLRDFLDSNQYVDDSVAMYEWIFGRGFISPGGAAQNLHCAAFLHVTPGQRMLDVGCGIGGSPAQLAQRYGCHVTGVDLSSNMLEVFAGRLRRRPDSRLRLALADVATHDFGCGEFDCVYSRDCIPHITHKGRLFKRFHTWLKPAGRLLVTTYALGRGTVAAGGDFDAYVKQRHYDLQTEEYFQQICEQAGFAKVEVHDVTSGLRHILLDEMDKAQRRRDDFVKEFSVEKYDKLLAGWRDKIGYIDCNCLVWLMIICKK